MTRQITAVLGRFRTTLQADKAVSRLTSAGFSNSDVSLLNQYRFSYGIPERCEGYAKEGGILLAVQCSNSLEIDRANIILKQNGAEAISSSDEKTFSTPDASRP